MIHALSIDVEDYWSIFSRDWLGVDIEPTEAVVRNTHWFLDTLRRHNVKATFFVLGAVAQKFPELVKSIASGGHEIGTHGMSHKQIFRLEKEQFRAEARDSKKLLEDIASVPVRGFRAPAFSITPATQWALDILAEEGFEYDSSVFPIAGKRYGWPGFSKDICKLTLPSGGRIVEVPMSAVTVLGKDLPACGGGYLRHFPYIFTKWTIKKIQRQRPIIIYVHPHEIDTMECPLDFGSLSYEQNKKAKGFHKMQMRNRHTVKDKLIRLLNEFQFCPISHLIEKH